MELVLTKEQQDKLDATKAARAAKATARNAAANEAHVTHLFGHAEGDEMQLIVYTMPVAFGGKVIYKLPIHEKWAEVQKKALDAILKNKDTPDAAASYIAENTRLLLYPDVSVLQSWQEDLPGLYTQIKSAFEERCDEGKVVSGK